MALLGGTFWVLLLYDVAEEIRLDELRAILGVQRPAREPRFKHPAPEYVRFERPPVVEALEPVVLRTGERLDGFIRYFDYGVVSVELFFDFEADWERLVSLSSHWISAPDLEQRTQELVRKRMDRMLPAMNRPYSEWVSEDYYIIHVREAGGQSARELLAVHGDAVAQILRGESRPLSDEERQEALQSCLSYYPTDLLVVGWMTALIYDTPEGAAPAIQLLEYANTQLLEFRHYDNVLTQVLAGVYQSLQRRGGLWQRWRMAGEARRLNAIRLEVIELSERTDNAIKFLSDMFYTRAYRLAADKVGVADYRRLVDAKLRTAGELYEFMVNEFHQARAFVLEALVVAILVIELVALFRGGYH